jgi:hypothetical protein
MFREQLVGRKREKKEKKKEERERERERDHNQALDFTTQPTTVDRRISVDAGFPTSLV